MKNNGKWYNLTWKRGHWQFDLDLTCFGLGIGYVPPGFTSRWKEQIQAEDKQ